VLYCFSLKKGVEVANYEFDSGNAVVHFGGINCERDVLQAIDNKEQKQREKRTKHKNK